MTSDIALRLVSTSVEDMRDSLDCAEHNGEPYSIYCLSLALGIVAKRNEKTKANLLLARIKRYEKDLSNEN